jgi:hypothetical protein
MSLINGRHPVALELAHMLGLETKRLVSYTVHVKHDESVTVTATYLAEDNTKTQAAQMLTRRFHLREIEQ